MINALLGERYLAEGVLPTTNEINVLKWAGPADDEQADTQASAAAAPPATPACFRPAFRRPLCYSVQHRRPAAGAASPPPHEEEKRQKEWRKEHLCCNYNYYYQYTSLRARMQDSDGVFVRHLPAELLREVNVVDTPGTNVILGRQQRLTEEYVPRADLVSCSSLRPMAGCPRVACLRVDDGRRLQMGATPPPGSAALLAARPADPVLSSHPEPPIPDPASPPMPFPPFLTTTHTHAYPLTPPPPNPGRSCL